MLNFSDTTIAFSHRSDKELKKAYWLFYSIKFPWLTKIGTGFIKLIFWLHLPFKSIIKNTLFNHFCGGEFIDDCNKTINNLGKYNVGTILDYSVEGESTEKVFEHTKNEIKKTILKAKETPSIPFSVFKVTGVAPLEILQKKQEHNIKTADDQKTFDQALKRIDELCGFAFDNDVKIFIDAEESWIQNTIDDIAHDMMKKYNVEKTIVFNTIQFYKKNALTLLREAHQKAIENNYFYGVKMVRGAYMEKERLRAKELGYESPIHDTKENTDICFNEGLNFCVQHVDKISLCAGTHNEISSNLLVDLLEKNSLEKNHSKIYFAQLFGMSDHISYNLSANQYNVAKYVPYGPVKSVLPYLFRRAEENTSIAGQTGRELSLIEKELKRRKS